MRAKTAATLAGLAILLAGASSAAAAEVQPQGWHVVRPGDTLKGLTRAYSGSSDPWRENWGLNSFVANPDLLLPGWRLRLLLQPERSRPAAQVVEVSRRVEAKPDPQPWGAAQVGDLLLDHDGIRTFEAASADLAFTDGGSLRLTESSLVFLARPARGVQPGRRAVEIVEGQADLAVTAGESAGLRREVEVVAGAARGTLRTAADQPGASRLRKLPAGDSHWMVYQGSGSVTAAGQKVDLPAGTGSKVAPKAPPTPAEQLLPAPTTHAVAGRAAVASHLELAWEPVPGAVAYVVELCPGSDCGVALERATGITETLWHPVPVPPGDYAWRVNAVAVSGLDGFPTPSARFTALDHEPDPDPPVARLGVGGPHVEIDGKPLFAANAQVRLTASDVGSGIAERTVQADGEPTTEGRLLGPWTSGEHRVAARVVDAAGNVTTVGPLVFTVDADSPVIVAEPSEPATESRSEWRALSLLDWTVEQGWSAWRWVASERKLASGVARSRWSVAPDVPSLRLAMRGAAELTGGIAVTLDDGRSLRLTAHDDGAGVASLRLRPKQRALGKEKVLVIQLEATDRLGNASRLAFEVLTR